MANLRNVGTWPDTLLTQFKAQLVAAGLATTDYVYLCTEENWDLFDPPTTQDYFYYLVLGPQIPQRPQIAGGGNVVPYIRGEMAVTVWNRFDVDQNKRDDAYLTDTTYGILQKMRGVFKAYQLFDPKNPSNDFYLGQPMQLSTSGWRLRPRNPQRQPPTGCGSLTSTWEFFYLADMS